MQQLLSPTTDTIGDSLAPGIRTEEAQLMLASAEQLLRGSINANSIEIALEAIDADIAELFRPHVMPHDTGRTRWTNPDNTDTGHMCISS